MTTLLTLMEYYVAYINLYEIKFHNVFSCSDFKKAMQKSILCLSVFFNFYINFMLVHAHTLNTLIFSESIVTTTG